MTAKKLSALISFWLASTASGFSGFTVPSATSDSSRLWRTPAMVAAPQLQSSSRTVLARTGATPPTGPRRHRRRGGPAMSMSLFRREISDLERWACQAAATALTVIPLALTFTSAATAASTLPPTTTTMAASSSSAMLAATAFSSAAMSSSSSSVFAPVVDPLLEAEVLNDMAHVALDMFTVFGPARLVTRLAAIIGRVCAMLADYVPDHKVLPEELVFQSIMMLLACWGLLQALLPMLLAAVLVPTGPSTLLRDGKAFAALFQPSGVTWSQFKAMRALCVDWMEVEPHAMITPQHDEDGNGGVDVDDNGDCVYWLHRGQANVLSNDGRKVVSRIEVGTTTPSYKVPAGRRLLGETRLLTTTTKLSGIRFATATATATASTNRPSSHQIQAGPNGATLLRIRPRKLRLLLQADPSLAEAWRTLVVSSLHDKLLAQLEEGSNNNEGTPTHSGGEPSITATAP